MSGALGDSPTTEPGTRALGYVQKFSRMEWRFEPSTEPSEPSEPNSDIVRNSSMCVRVNLKKGSVGSVGSVPSKEIDP